MAGGKHWYWMIDSKVAAEFRAEGYKGPIYATESDMSIQYYTERPWSERHEEESNRVANEVSKHTRVPVWIEDFWPEFGQPEGSRLIAGDEREQKATA